MKFETTEVAVRYGRGAERALEDLTMSVPPGCLYLVLGPNGSGKSTLMRALLGTVPLEAGEIRLDDRPLSRWTREEMALSVGAVAQSEHMSFPLSVSEYVGMGRYPHLGPFRGEGERDRKVVADALRRCDAERFSGREVGTLSAGELQRVRIARALAQEPRALILDEPTANLDIRHEMKIFQLLRSAAQEGVTVILITHHLDIAGGIADRILLLNRGRIAAEGSVEEVLRPEILEPVYEWRLAVRPDPDTGLPRVSPRF
jgi:iron complex transport system ATP-binding protein